MTDLTQDRPASPVAQAVDLLIAAGIPPERLRDRYHTDPEFHLVVFLLARLLQRANDAGIDLLTEDEEAAAAVVARMRRVAALTTATPTRAVL